jgi:hypothetical protein
MIKMLYAVRDCFTRFLVPFIVLLTAEAFPVRFSHDYLYHDVAIWTLCRNLQKRIHSFASLSCLVDLETTSAKNLTTVLLAFEVP